MLRFIRTAPFPGIPESIPTTALVVTPHRPAAQAVHRSKFTLQQLARQVLAERGVYAAEPRVAARFLREAIVEADPHADAGAIAGRIAPVLQTVLRVGVDTAALKGYGSPRAAKLATIAEAVRARLRARGLVANEELVWEAANSPGIDRRQLFVYGYTRARIEEVAFIDRIAGDGSVYYLPVVDGADVFAANGTHASRMLGWRWTVDNAGDNVPETIGERAAAKFVGVQEEPPSGVAAHCLHDVDSEVRYVLGEVKGLLRAGVPAGEITVVARDLNLYAKEFALVGAEYRVPTMSSMRVPLSETLVGGLVHRLLSVVERDFRFEETARLLGHPLGPGMSDGTWRDSRRGRTESFHAWLALEESLGCLEDLREGEPKSVSHWVKCLRSIFLKFKVRSRAGHIAREIVAYNCLQEELSFLAADEDEMSFTDFATAIRDILGNVRTAFDPSRLGVLITEPNVIVGGRFRHVFVLGLAEGVLPAPPSDNPVIDFHERRLLAAKGIDFEEAAEIPRWEAMSFFSLLSTATESLTLTHPKTIGKEEKIESSYFGRSGLRPGPAQPARLCSHVELIRNTLRKAVDPTDPISAAAGRQLTIERRRESADPHDEYDGVIGRAIDLDGRVWSVSQLTALAGCGFRWFANYGLRVRPPDEMDLEVSPAALGKLFHYALHFAVSEGKAKTREEIIHLLDHALASGYHDHDVAMPRIPNWDLRRAEYVARLTRAVNAEGFLPEGSEIIATEQDFTVMLHDLQIRGRIDRVDRTIDGLVAVDYKNAKKKPDPVSDREGRKLDLQIAVYLAALKRLYPDDTVAGGTYYSLSSCKGFPADVAEEAVLKGFLEGVTAAPRTGSLPVHPVSSNTCTYCDYDQLCRNGSRIVRKEAAAQ